MRLTAINLGLCRKVDYRNVDYCADYGRPGCMRECNYALKINENFERIIMRREAEDLESERERGKVRRDKEKNLIAELIEQT